MIYLEQEKQNEEIKENLNKEHQVAMQELQDKYEREIKEIEDKFAAEMQTVIKEKDKALEKANEQHHRELEAAKQELVKTHMEKFTLMTEELDKSHQVCLRQCLSGVFSLGRRTANFARIFHSTPPNSARVFCLRFSFSP